MLILKPRHFNDFTSNNLRLSLKNYLNYHLKIIGQKAFLLLIPERLLVVAEKVTNEVSFSLSYACMHHRTAIHTSSDMRYGSTKNLDNSLSDEDLRGHICGREWWEISTMLSISLFICSTSSFGGM